MPTVNVKASKRIDMLRSLKCKLNRSPLEKIICIYTTYFRICKFCMGFCTPAGI